MFKKIIILAIVFSPFLISVFMGYPIISKTEYQKRSLQSELHYSYRCNDVSDFKGLLSCYKKNPRINSLQFFITLKYEVSALHPYFDIVLFSALVGQIALGIFFVIGL